MARQSFEKAMQQLEKIVEELEAGDIPLEKAIQRFEEGTRLAQACNRQLDEIEKRITLLTQTAPEEVIETGFTEETESRGLPF